MWLASRESKNTETASDGSRLVGRLEKPKMWRSVEHLRSLSLSCAPEDSSITERVSRDMESTLKYQPKSTDSPSSRVAFNLEEERKRMAEWTAEQERIRKVGPGSYRGVPMGDTALGPQLLTYLLTCACRLMDWQADQLLSSISL